MSVNDVAAGEVVTLPGLWILRVTHRFVPFQGANSVSRRDHNLQILPRLKLAGCDTPTDRRDLNGFEFSTHQIFKPVISGEKIEPPVAVDVRGCESFGVLKRAALAGAARKDF